AAEIEIRAGVEDVAAPLEAAESGQLDPDRVGAGDDRSEDELARPAGDGATAGLRPLVGERDGGAGNPRGPRVDDGGRDGAGVLREGGCGDERERDGSRDRPP